MLKYVSYLILLTTFSCLQPETREQVAQDSGVLTIDSNPAGGTTQLANSSSMYAQAAQMPWAMVGQNFESPAPNVGGASWPYSYSLAMGSTQLPPGLVLNESTGKIMGVPTSPGSWSNIIINVTDSSGASQSLSALTLNISEPLVIQTPLNNIIYGTQGNSIPASSMNVTGGSSPYQFSVVNGALPAGISISNQGTLAGAPLNAIDQANVIIRVTDANGLTIDSNPISFDLYPPLVANITVPNAITLNQEISPIQIMASGGRPPYTYSTTQGSLPTGLELLDNGVVSGAPTQVGSYGPIVLTVTDANGASTNLIPMAIQVLASLTVPNDNITINAMAGVGLPPISLLQPSDDFIVAGGNPPYSLNLNNPADLPAGLIFNSNGTISGTTTATSASSSTLSVTITDNIGATGSYNINLNLAAYTPDTQTGVMNTSNFINAITCYNQPSCVVNGDFQDTSNASLNDVTALGIGLNGPDNVNRACWVKPGGNNTVSLYTDVNILNPFTNQQQDTQQVIANPMNLTTRKILLNSTHMFIASTVDIKVFSNEIPAFSPLVPNFLPLLASIPIANNKDMAFSPSGDHLYVANSTNSIKIIPTNISSCSSTPSTCIIHDFGVGASINEIKVHDNHLFVATNSNLQIFSLNNETNPGTPIAIYQDNLFGSIKHIAIDANHAYLSNGTNRLRLLSIINKSNPVPTETITIANIRSVHFDKGYLFIATQQNNTGLIRVHSTAKPTDLKLVGEIPIDSIPDKIFITPPSTIISLFFPQQANRNKLLILGADGGVKQTFLNWSADIVLDPDNDFSVD